MIQKLSFGILILVFTACSCQQEKKEEAGESENDAEVTIESLTTQINAGGLSPTVFFERAQLYFEQGDIQASADDALRAISLDSNRVEFYHLLSDIQLNALQSRNALKSLEKAVRLEPENRFSLLKLLELQILLRQYIPAISTSQRLLVIDPQDSETFFLRGIIFKEQGLDSLAIVNFQRTVDLNSDMTEAFIMLGDLHEKQSSPLAEGYYQNAVNSDPENISALFTQAFYFQNHDKKSEAIDIYARMMQIDSSFVPAYVNSAILLMEKDSVAQAESQLLKALEFDTTFLLTHYYLGECAVSKGDREMARKRFEKALQLDPEYSDAIQALKKL